MKSTHDQYDTTGKETRTPSEREADERAKASNYSDGGHYNGYVANASPEVSDKELLVGVVTVIAPPFVVGGILAADHFIKYGPGGSSQMALLVVGGYAATGKFNMMDDVASGEVKAQQALGEELVSLAKVSNKRKPATTCYNGGSVQSQNRKGCRRQFS